MKTNQNIVHGFYAGLASQSSAMLRAMLAMAMRACQLGLRTDAKAAWAATWLRQLVCWLDALVAESAELFLVVAPRHVVLAPMPGTSLDLLLMRFSFLGRCLLPVFVSLLLFLISVVLLVLLFPVISSTLFLASCFIVILGSRGPLQVECQLELAPESGEFCLHGHDLIFIR
jgi:hypothetical protein